MTAFCHYILPVQLRGRDLAMKTLWKQTLTLPTRVLLLIWNELLQSLISTF